MKHLLRLWPYIRTLRKSYVQGLVAVLLAAAAGMTAPLFIKAAIDELERGARREFIVYTAIAIVVFAVLRAIFIFAGRTILLTASRALEFDLRNDLFRHLEHLPAAWYDRHRSGDLTSRVINDLEGLRMLTGMGVMAISNTGLTFIFSMAGLWYLDWKLALISLVPLSLVSVVTVATGGPMHRRSLEVQDQLAVLSSRAQENFSGARVVKAFVQEDAEIDRFRAQCAIYQQRNLALARTRGFAWASMTLFMEAAIVVTLHFGGARIIEDSFTVPKLVAFTTFQFQLVWPMIAIGWVISLAQRGAACMGRISEILDEPLAPDGTAPDPKTPFSGDIEFRNLTFAYDAERGPALKDLTFRVKPGQRVGIVGRTGAGKSSIGALLLRLYEPPPGALFVDGVDITTIPVDRLRSQIGPVPQDIFLFSDTIRNNIAFGATGDAINGAVEEAATVAAIAEEARRFPGGLDQRIGERGVTLSGGQKQRTALARAIVRQPSILVLDDALSSVDADTERAILGGLRNLGRGRTVLIMTHRLATIADADLVLVLDEGHIVDQGTPSALLAKPGPFRSMWERQRLAAEVGA